MTGYAAHKIFSHACQMFMDFKGAFRTWYLSERIEVLTGVATGCSIEELSVEHTSLFLSLRSCLCVTKGALACGKMPCVC